MAHGDGDPLWVVPMKTTHEMLPLGQRLRLSMQSAMNSRLPKRTVLPREKAHIRHSLLAATVSANE
jgi:hypothetical protein